MRPSNTTYTIFLFFLLLRSTTKIGCIGSPVTYFYSSPGPTVFTRFCLPSAFTAARLFRPLHPVCLISPVSPRVRMGAVHCIFFPFPLLIVSLRIPVLRRFSYLNKTNGSSGWLGFFFRLPFYEVVSYCFSSFRLSRFVSSVSFARMFRSTVFGARVGLRRVSQYKNLPRTPDALAASRNKEYWWQRCCFFYCSFTEYSDSFWCLLAVFGVLSFFS